VQCLWLGLYYAETNFVMEFETVRPKDSQVYWKADYMVEECPLCKNEFGFFTRRHHCRNCGGIFCDECSSKRIRITQLGYEETVRVCDVCFREVYIPLSKKDADVKSWLLMVSNNPKLNKKIFQGVPNRLRPTLWPRLSDSSDLVEKSPKVYETLVRNKHRSRFRDQIESDIQRTFPENVIFQDPEGAGQRNLSNILNCFTLLQSEVGYCQGMNFLAAVLCMQLDEENAFWLFVQLMKKYSLEGFYTESAPLLQQTLKKFDYWMAELLPKLHDHFKREGIAVSIFASQWFRTLFSYNFPIDIVFRIWDVFLLEGIDFLIWIGLITLDACQEQLLHLHTMDILNFFKHLPKESFVSLAQQLNAQTT